MSEPRAHIDAAPRDAREHRLLRTLAIGLAAFAIGYLVWHVRDVLVTIFAGVLFGVFLRAVAAWVADHTALGPRWALALSLVVIAGALVGLFWWRGAEVVQQFETLRQQLPAAVQQIRDLLARWGLADEVFGRSATVRDLVPERYTTFSRVTGMISTTLSALVTLLVILFIGIVVAAQPRLYVAGVLHLVPKARRDRAREILDQLGFALRRWLLGQLVSMTAVGVMTGIGLWLLGMPLVLVLALIAFLLEFVPVWGPWLSGVPAVLIALAIDPTKALWVALLYLGVQLVESYVIYPYVQWRAVYLPPALLIATQLVLGVLVGLLGVALAAPILAAMMVLVRTIYVESVLGDRDVETAAREGGG